MTDSAVVLLAAASFTGALMARPVPLWMAAALLAGFGLVVGTAQGRTCRWAAALMGAVALLLAASALGARSEAGLRPPPAGTVEGRATLVTDPSERAGSVHADVRLGGRRYDTWARGEAGRVLAGLLAGDSARVAGRRSALREPWRSRLAYRHVLARLSVSAVSEVRRATGPSGVANAARRAFVRGERGVPQHQRPLLGGFVLGDDRGQDDAVVDDFRSSGLSHLLVVSGQNVAFVLALLAPLVRRGPRWWRLGWGTVVLLGFGLLTRWEPSVLRAVGMASLALLASTGARAASTVRLLALAVTALLLVDPLLAGSVGFRLSVCASGGIAVFGPRLTRRLPEPLAVTIAAQAGVAPILASSFGGIPVVAPVANLLAVPLAAPIVVWGVPASAAVAVGVPDVVHVPTRVLLTWVSWVARTASGLPLGQLRTGHLVVLAAAVALSAAARGRLRRAGAVVAALVMLQPLAVNVVQPEPHVRLAAGSELWRDHGVAVLVTDGRAPLLGPLRARGVRHLDVLVATRPGRSVADAVLPVLSRLAVTTVIAPPGSQLPGTRSPTSPVRLRAAGATLLVSPGEDGLEVRAE